MKKRITIPVYDASKDGNVFAWIHKAARKYRDAKGREREAALKRSSDTKALQK